MSILTLLFPYICAVCHRQTRHHVHHNICDECCETLIHPPKICIFCDTFGSFLCHFCKKSMPKLEKIHIAFQYDTAIKQLIQQLKYSLKPYLAETISFITWQHHIHFFESLPTDTIIMPMPSGRLRVAKRGYNPAALIAKNLAQLSGFHYSEHYLLKKAFSIPQTSLSRHERLQNLNNQFYLNHKYYHQPNLPPILLIDDVITTGRSFEKAMEKLNNPQTKQLFGLFIAQS